MVIVASRKMKRVVRVGNVAIPIYMLGNGKFAIWYKPRPDLKRKKFEYTALPKAKWKAEEIAVAIANRRADTADFSEAERQDHIYIKKVAASLGVAPVSAIDQWAEWKKQSAAGPRRELVPIIIEQLLISKSDHKLSERYMRDLRWLRLFGEKFPVRIDEIRALQIETLLRELGVGARRRNNIRDVIVTLFLFAKEHGYLPQDRTTEAEKVKRIDLEHGAPQIYTPAQLRVILEHVSPEWIDWICCQAFEGIRPEEAGRPHVSKKNGAVRKLMWSDFMWDERQVRIVAAISKTKRDRYITINDTFLAWCGHHRDETGPVCIHDRPDRETERLGKLLGFDWINDGLRHSYASYWQSLHKDMQRLKEEMGNSEQVNRRFYYHPQPAAIAKKWWAVLPDEHTEAGGRKVLQLPLGMSFVPG